jgi:ABC-2 type transport system permease protein
MIPWAWALLVMVAKEIRQFWRDRPLFLFVAYVFTVNVMMAGSEEQDSAKMHFRVAVHDGDRSIASRDLVYRYRTPMFQFAGYVSGTREGMRALETQRAVLFLDIPSGFQERLRQGRPVPELQLMVDTSASTEGFLASSYAQAIVSEFATEWSGASQARASLPVVTNQARVWFNPEMRTSWFQSVNELLMMTMVCCVLLPCSALVREKERGTIEQLLVCPISPLQIVLSKVLAMTLVMVTGTALCLYLIVNGVFGAPLRGSMPLYLALTGLFAFVTAGVGVVISTYCRNSAQSGMMTLLIAMPMILLSGTWTPAESMPLLLRQVVDLMPLRHFLNISYGILVRGATFADVAPSALWLVGIGAVYFTLGLWRFRRQM